MRVSMSTLPRLAALAVLALVSLTAAAEAQSDRTFVASGGLSTGDCTKAAPCRSLSYAATKTLSFGIIFVSGPDSVDGGAITKNLTIIGDGRAVFETGVDANLPPDGRITMSGLKFWNAGITMSGSGKLVLRDISIDRKGFFGEVGVGVFGNAGARVSLENVSISNAGIGVDVKGNNGAANTVFITNSVIDQSVTSAVRVDGAANNAVISSSVLSGSGAGTDLSLLNGGRTVSYRNNVIRSGTPTQSLPTN